MFSVLEQTMSTILLWPGLRVFKNIVALLYTAPPNIAVLFKAKALHVKKKNIQNLSLIH